MYLKKNWIEKAFSYHKDKKVAVVSGYWKQKIKGKGLVSGKRNTIELATKESKKVFGASGLFKANILKKINFYPYIPRAVDLELGARLVSSGYKLLKISEYMFIHEDVPESTFSFIRKSILRGIGLGTIAKSGNKFSVIFNIGIFKVSVAVFAYFVFSILAILTMQNFLYLVVLGWLLGIVSFMIKYRGTKQGFYNFILIFVKSFGLAYGVLKPLKNAKSYPISSVKRIK